MVDTATTEEILRRHPRWSYVRTDRNSTRYFIDYTCGRCGGKGGWEGWPGFTCYECGGSGRSTGETIKVYTPEHEAKLAAQRAKRAEKTQKEREAKAIAERSTKLEALGFGKEEDTYVLYRVVGDTFSIKDQLKELGCRYRPVIGWYSSKPLDGYECQRMEEKEVLTDNIFIEWQGAQELKEKLIENLRPKVSASEWQGEVGSRLDLRLHVDRIFKSDYASWGKTSYMFLMSDAAGNKYKWSTSKWYNEGEDIHIRATVKEHSEYKGEKQTVLTRGTDVKEN